MKRILGTAFTPCFSYFKIFVQIAPICFHIEPTDGFEFRSSIFNLFSLLTFLESNIKFMFAFIVPPPKVFEFFLTILGFQGRIFKRRVVPKEEFSFLIG